MMYSMLLLDSVTSLYWWGSYHYGTQYSNVQAYKYAESRSYTHTFRVVALVMLFTYVTVTASAGQLLVTILQTLQLKQLNN